MACSRLLLEPEEEVWAEVGSRHAVGSLAEIVSRSGVSLWMIDRKPSPIEPASRSLITVRVSQINECHFCMDLNSATLLKRGASIDKVEALEDWRHSKCFGEREQVALEFAERLRAPIYRSAMNSWTA
jgi:AhpD family alkylhydroperoxidase